MKNDGRRRRSQAVKEAPIVAAGDSLQNAIHFDPDEDEMRGRRMRPMMTY